MTTADPKDVFQQEAQDLLAVLETTLLDLEHRPDDSALIDTAFRALHTIKGSGAMFGFDAVAAFTHHVETAFERVRLGTLAPTRPLIAVALKARDHMRALIETPDDADLDVGAALLAELSAIVSGAGGAPVVADVAAAPAASGLATWRIAMRLPRDTMANGTNPLGILDDVRALGDAKVTAITDDIPPLAEMDPSACYVHWVVELTTTAPLSAIEDAFMFVRDEMDLDIRRLDVPAPAPVETAPAAVAAAPVVATAAPAAPAPAPATANDDGAKRANARASSLRVPAERLDELMERVGELVITQSRLRQIANTSADPHVKSVSEEIERLVLELRDSTMGIRMVPIGSLFGRFRRVVHDLSRDLGKEVEIVMHGEETELDKTVIEQLNDPLVHMIRNAIDHGLELPAERAGIGKPPIGRMTLSAVHAGTEVLITLADDGRGLDKDRIRARAIERGLIAADATLTDSELFQLIFLPGFSTAKAVTSLSGRGVGMDVVRRTIEGLRGSIDVASTPGAGTKVTLRLPLTLAIIDGLLVRVGNGRYVLPLAAVEECVELSADLDARARALSFLNIRDELVPFLRLRELFSVGTPADPYQKVVVVSSGDNRVGLVVDQVIGDHQTVIKSMSKLHADLQMFSGATILGDGAVALILDIAHLVAFGQVKEDQLRAAG
jgi:two-component system chemotaxis sensor kinase CheA